MKRNFKIKIIILSILIFGFSHNVHAANLLISSDKNEVKNKEVFTTTLFLDTEGELINTIEGDLIYDEKYLNAEVVNTGGSFVSFWIEKPDIKTKSLIHFAGVVPGGISSRQGEVFSVIFRGEQAGVANLKLDNINLFLNDGKGSVAQAKLSDENIKITKGEDGPSLPVVLEDTVSPENFSIVRTKDPFIYDNKYFVVFSTLDKKSGIDYYEICEYWSCVLADSPYLLRYQNPFYYITVHAYDINGNMRESVLISQSILVSLPIILLLLAIIYLYRRYLSRYKL